MANSLFQHEAIVNLLDRITATYENNDQFVAALFEENKVAIRFTSLDGIDVSQFTSVVISTSTDVVVNVAVTYTTGPEIIPFIGDIEKDIPYKIENDQGLVLGGDQCINTANPGYYGTISFTCREISIEAKGSYGTRKCGATTALVSNNHVIGRNDAGRTGEIIWTPSVADMAALKCYIPLSVQPNIDIAVAIVTRVSDTHFWEIREIGVLKGIRRPALEPIRKFGATTGLTSGSVIGHGNIKVGKYTYRNVFISSGGFACPGDSGSAIVSAGNDLLGIHTWGDNILCANNPKGYFFTLDRPGTLTDEGAIIEISTT